MNSFKHETFFELSSSAKIMLEFVYHCVICKFKQVKIFLLDPRMQPSEVEITLSTLP